MLHYSTHLHPSSKTWVTFVHGAGGSSSIWFKQLREFSKHFNVLLLDLRGHGKSRMQLTNVFKKKHTFDVLAEDIIAILDKENIKSSHFVGISLGTILIRQIGEMYPQRVQSMVMAGAIMKLNVRSQILMRFGNICKSIIPYLWLYRLFAYIIMPKRAIRSRGYCLFERPKNSIKKNFYAGISSLPNSSLC